jgi:hypothetical protein
LQSQDFFDGSLSPSTHQSHCFRKQTLDTPLFAASETSWHLWAIDLFLAPFLSGKKFSLSETPFLSFVMKSSCNFVSNSLEILPLHLVSEDMFSYISVSALSTHQRRRKTQSKCG